jgi:hypothetical protein
MGDMTVEIYIHSYVANLASFRPQLKLSRKETDALGKNIMHLALHTNYGK